MTQSTATHRPDTKLSKPHLNKTEAQVKEIQDLIKSGKSDLDIVRHIAGQIDVSVNADARLACIKFVCRSATLLNSGQAAPSADSLAKHHLAKAMEMIKTVIEDFLQHNPYHAEYSYAAIYEAPTHRDESWSHGSTWHYGAKASATLWQWPKIETDLKDWLKKQPVSKEHDTIPGVNYRLTSGMCHVSIIDSRGKEILKNEFAAMHATVKTNGKEVTGVTIR
jgi:hypothetical protein